MERLLADLGYPEPPLRLEDVRELLRLDLRHYSSHDVDWLQGKLHKLKVAGKQVLARPTLILEVVRKLDLKALFIPDRKRILVDGELPEPKKRWNEGHEIIHRVLPWHDGVALGDKKRTLSLSCHAQIENEANYGAGRMLFLGPRFRRHLDDLASTDYDAVRVLAKHYGNSMTTTLWRVVENLDTPALGLVSLHPKEQPGESPVRYFIRSPAFAEQFPTVSELDLFDLLRNFCWGNRGPIGSDEVLLTDANGLEHVFFLETFFNHHEALTLGVHRGVRSASVSVKSSPL